MSESLFDVLVIGRGPGGSSAATFLARSEHRVLVLEKEKFPRFHVGESLLPLNRTLFEEMGIWPALEAAGKNTMNPPRHRVGYDWSPFLTSS